MAPTGRAAVRTMRWSSRWTWEGPRACWRSAKWQWLTVVDQVAVASRTQTGSRRQQADAQDERLGRRRLPHQVPAPDAGRSRPTGRLDDLRLLRRAPEGSGPRLAQELPEVSAVLAKARPGRWTL